MALLDFTLPGSDPTTPNTFIQTPQQVAYQQALAQQLMNEGSSTAPIRSPWQGAANLAKALMGGWQMGDAARQQRLGQADATAAFGSAIGADPGNLDIPSTPGASTATLRASDALQDQIQDTGVDPRRAAMVAALGGGGGGTPAAGGGAPALAAALGGVNGSSRGMRNNNPGNLEANGWTSNLPGYKGTDGRFAIFDTPEHGVAAMDANLQGYARKGINTPLAIASTWAPGSEQGNNPGSYGGAIARALGVGLNDKIDMSDPATRAKVESAMALVENGPGGATNPGAGAGGAGGPPSPAGGLPGIGRPDPTALINVLSNPWATPGQQQIAQTLLSAQMPTPPTFGVIGKDPITGVEQYGWISPKTMTTTPASGSGGSPLTGGALPPLPPGPGPAPAPAPGVVPPAPAAPAGAGGIGSDAAAAARVPPPASPGPAPVPAPGAPNPAPQTISGSVNLAAANGLTPQGDAWLKSMEAAGGSYADVARRARAVVEGREVLPDTGSAGTKPIDVAVTNAVMRAAPNFDTRLAQARVDLVKSFGDKTSTSSAGGQMIAANTGLHHLAALADSANNLGNGNFPAINWLRNEGKDATVGNPTLKAYEINKQALAEELGKLYKGGSPAEAEVHALVSNLTPNMTPAEQQAVFAKVATLLQGKTTELQRQWQTAFGANSTYPVIGEEGQAILKRFGGGGAAVAQPGAPGPAPVATVKTPADVKNLPSGTRFVIPDGSGRIGVAP